jgi:MFS family permease
MWFAWGMAFTDYDFRNRSRRMDFIRHNGDLLIIYALIAIAGGILTAITIGLFDSIGLSIGEFYAENIIIAGAASAPVVAAFITDSYPALLNRTAPLIAGIFSPLVLLTLIIFLVAMAVAGKDPYNNRDFLLIFNVMLLGVMAIIIYSVSGTQAAKPGKFNRIVLFVLSIISIAIDLVALSAIFYRLGEYGLTPNKLAVLASNILVLVNLIMIMTDLFRINFRNREFRTVECTVAKYLPVYLAWIIFVVFCFPLIFGMK